MSTAPVLETSVEPRPFGPGSKVWDEFGDVLNLALSGGAFVLQAMHPMVADAVSEHSVFREDPVGRAVRSLDSVVLWAYGGEEAIAEGQRLRELHKPIRGRRGGRAYSALNPEAYAWVHQTAFVTAVRAAPYLTGSAMSLADQEAYYEEILQLGDLLQIRRSLMPPDVPSYWEYYDSVVSSVLECNDVTDTLLDMIRRVRVPYVPRSLAPVGWPAQRAWSHFQYLMVFATLDPRARAMLGVSWTGLHEAQLRLAMSTIRPVFQRLPEQYRYVPFAYHSRERARALASIKHRATKSLT